MSLNEILKIGYIGLITIFVIIIFSGIVIADVNEDQIVTLIHGTLNDLPYQYYQVIELGVQEGDTLKVSVEVLDSGMPVDVFLESFMYQQTGPYSGEAKWTFLGDAAYYGITKKTFSREINDMNKYHLVIGSSNPGRVHVKITANAPTPKPPPITYNGGGSGGGGKNTTGFEAFLAVFVIALLVIWRRK